MKNKLILIAALATLALPAMADQLGGPAAENTQNAKLEKLINVATKQNIRIQALEKKLQQLDDQHSAEIDNLGKTLQATRDQVARLVVRLDKKIDANAKK